MDGISHKNVLNMEIPELEVLGEQLRSIIIRTCHQNGGHLGASLGAIEIILSILNNFNPLETPIVFDVGHQAYAYKILTPRTKPFESLRQFGGQSGFLKRTESSSDWFGAGHSSTAISAAFGFSYHRKDWTIAVLGDGAFGSGLTYEAIQQSLSFKHGPVLLILNDNGMSISHNVNIFSQQMGSAGFKAFVEFFGIHYLGPMDGHDLRSLSKVISEIKESKQFASSVVLLHLRTQKGKGYQPAEDDPVKFHGVQKVEPTAGLNKNNFQMTWQQQVGEQLVELGKKDPKVVVITPAMSEGSGLTAFAKAFPDRFFDVGICESHAVTFAAGLAFNGFKPIVSIYSTFLARATDQILHDVCLQSANVAFLIDRSGFVGQDGETHQGLYELGYLTVANQLSIFQPIDVKNFTEILETWTKKPNGPIAIRYPRGVGQVDLLSQPALSKIVKTRNHGDYTFGSGKELLIFWAGPMMEGAVVDLFSKYGERISLRIISEISTNTPFVENVDAFKYILCVDRTAVSGLGLFRVLNALNLQGVKFERLFVDLKPTPHGSVEQQLAFHGVSDSDFMNRVSELLRE